MLPQIWLVVCVLSACIAKIGTVNLVTVSSRCHTHLSAAFISACPVAMIVIIASENLRLRCI